MINKIEEATSGEMIQEIKSFLLQFVSKGGGSGVGVIRLISGINCIQL